MSGADTLTPTGASTSLNDLRVVACGRKFHVMQFAKGEIARSETDTLPPNGTSTSLNDFTAVV